MNKEDIEDVENQSLLYCVSYCDQRIKEISEKQLKGIKEGIRADPKEREVSRNCAKAKGTIEQGVQKQQITVKDYDTMLLNLMIKDKQLAAYFNKVKHIPENQKKLDICMARFKCAKQERKEFEGHV